MHDTSRKSRYGGDRSRQIGDLLVVTSHGLGGSSSRSRTQLIIGLEVHSMTPKILCTATVGNVIT